MKRILVIGATGNIGQQVVAQLQAAGVRIRALVRNPDGVRLPAPVEVVRGDLTRPDSLDEGLSGVDAVFLVWTAAPSAVGAAMERILGQARRIVFLSSPYKTAHPLFQASQPNMIATMHAEIERLIEASGREWTFLRPGMLDSNARNWWAAPIRAGGPVRWPYLDAVTAPIDEFDIAAVAVRVLTDAGHGGAEYVLTGPESMSQREQIAVIGEVTGRALRIDEITPEEARVELARVIPAPAVNMLLTAWSAAIGQAALVTSTVAEITGVPARTFRNWAADHVADFRV